MTEANAAEAGGADGRATEPAGPGEPADADGAIGRDGAGPDSVGSDAPSADGTGTDDDGAEAAGPRKTRRKRRPFWVELPVLLVIALVIALIIKTFVVQAFFIPSSSMEDTLLIGDKVLVNKLVYHFRSIEPGDVVVFSGAGSWTAPTPSGSPSSDPLVRVYDATLGRLFHSIAGLYGTPVDEAGTVFIKRVVGVPGDRVVCCNAQGLVTVNGVALNEQAYLIPGARPSDAPEGFSGRFNITVPPGRLWVMGDNRPVSDDSRLRQGGPGGGTIPESAVIGRAFVIVWPPSRWRFLPIPSTFSQRGIDAPASALSAATSAGGLPVVAIASLPYLPLAAGFVVAVPLTWLQRRLRPRIRRRRRR
ncbi:MAG TPA: signal peptidase I [Streptosporangiaceae bacterium]|nr:signal peptidase I [Streptosporangiaceae bacterium]